MRNETNRESATVEGRERQILFVDDDPLGRNLVALKFSQAASGGLQGHDRVHSRRGIRGREARASLCDRVRYPQAVFSVPRCPKRSAKQCFVSLNQIAVSDRATLEGLTQFARRAFFVRS